MLGMLVYYVLSVTLLAAGAGAAGYQLYALLFGGLGALSPQLLLGAGASVALGRLALWRGRRRRYRIETRHREQVLLDLARRRGGLLEASEAARLIDVPHDEAQRLLEGLVRQGRADIEVTEQGGTRFLVGEQRLLGP
jgi:hypothetical protein